MSTAAALIARRRVSTLVLAHRTELLRQWQERLTGFLEFPKGSLDVIGSGKKKPSGKIDIAVMQSLSRREDLGELLDKYGQIIIDECHHLSAFSLEAILKQAKAKFVVGLTATPIRRDGHQPIIFMQCGPIRSSAARPGTAPAQLEVWPKALPAPEIPPDSPIQDVFRILAGDATRNRRIAGDILASGRTANPLPSSGVGKSGKKNASSNMNRRRMSGKLILISHQQIMGQVEGGDRFAPGRRTLQLM